MVENAKRSRVAMRKWNPKVKESSGLRGSRQELGQRGGQNLRWKETQSRKGVQRRILTEDQSLKDAGLEKSVETTRDILNRQKKKNWNNQINIFLFSGHQNRFKSNFISEYF